MALTFTMNLYTCRPAVCPYLSNIARAAGTISYVLYRLAAGSGQHAYSWPPLHERAQARVDDERRHCVNRHHLVQLRRRHLLQLEQPAVHAAQVDLLLVHIDDCACTHEAPVCRNHRPVTL
jgi:hypothetical protein